ncbi:MAG: metallophosphoesterase family protein [Candidatus Odinarchaeota archaeon]
MSDIHSNLHALKTVFDGLENVDAIIFSGDIVGYGASPNEVIDILKDMKPRMCVLGNHDYACLKNDFRWFNELAAQSLIWTKRVIKRENLDYISKLPLSETRDFEGVRVYVTHGSPVDNLYDYVYQEQGRDWRRFFKITESDIIILGHTHIPMIIKLKEKYIINPGSVGQPRDGNPAASYCVLNINRNVSVELKRVNYDIDKSAEEILDEGLPTFLAERLYTGI